MPLRRHGVEVGFIFPDPSQEDGEPARHRDAHPLRPAPLHQLEALIDAAQPERRSSDVDQLSNHSFGYQRKGSPSRRRAATSCMGCITPLIRRSGGPNRCPYSDDMELEASWREHLAESGSGRKLQSGRQAAAKWVQRTTGSALGKLSCGSASRFCCAPRITKRSRVSPFEPPIGFGDPSQRVDVA